MDGRSPNSSSNFSESKLDNGIQLRRRKLQESIRPDYTLLWREAGRLVRTAPPTPAQYIDDWVRAHDNLEDALLHTARLFDNRPTGDIKKTEQRLVSGALEEAQDFLKFYKEVLKQSPPNDLLHIAETLRGRCMCLDLG